ncbi:MAG: hypothetical protein KC593_08980 [Myxococcales bacterium]|nr:hypothetical protein [Myxococcales bacterium]MCB9629887.1 hypothetical protein [Sandaracinaceae bacterium]
MEELFAYALASESHSMRGQIQHAVKQSVPSFADDEEAILAWARTMLQGARAERR